MNNALKSLYEQQLQGISRIAEVHALDGPLMIQVNEELYQKSRYKILFIGQENNGWYGYVSTDLEKNLSSYVEFEMSKNGKSTTFWQYVHWVNEVLNPEMKGLANFAWTNISKFCTEDGLGLSHEIHEDCLAHMNCLQEEIQILRPDVVIFFSGPNYDAKLQSQFEGGVNYEQILPEISTREVSRVRAIALPEHSYRFYHPAYLQRSGKDDQVRRVLDFIQRS